VFQRLSRSYRASSAAFVAALICISLLVFLTSTDSTTRVSAVDTKGVGVYRDSGCGNPVDEIDWGTLNPGSVKNETVYVQNEEDRPMRFILKTENWTPLEAPRYLKLGWNYPAGMWTDPDDPLQITLTLSVSSRIESISSFRFDILVEVRDTPLGDVDLDYVVDGEDVIIVSNALWSYPGDPTYNPYADVNCDGSVDGGDRMIVANNLWEGWP
jgi:hypothetical protein